MRFLRDQRSRLMVPDRRLCMSTMHQAMLVMGGNSSGGSLTGWDPAAKDADVTLTNSNRTATNVSALGAVRGTQARDASGNRYFEILHESATSSSILVGIGTSSATLTNAFPGSDANGRGFFPFSQQTYNNNSATAYATPSPFVMAYVDLDGGAIGFIVDGVDQGTAYTFTPGSAWFPMWGSGTAGAGTRNGLANFGATAMPYAIPSGYSVWDAGATWNSADKAAAVTLSNGDLTASTTTSLGSVRATVSKTSGKWVFALGLQGADAVQLFGIATSSASLSTFPGGDANGYSYFYSGSESYGSRKKYTNNAATDYDNGKRIYGVQLVSGSIVFYARGASGPTAYSGLSGNYYPMWGPGTGTGTFAATINTGQSAFAFTAASAGLTAW
jgi:hypothetical protein